MHNIALGPRRFHRFPVFSTWRNFFTNICTPWTDIHFGGIRIQVKLRTWPENRANDEISEPEALRRPLASKNSTFCTKSWPRVDFSRLVCKVHRFEFVANVFSHSCVWAAFCMGIILVWLRNRNLNQKSRACKSRFGSTSCFSFGGIPTFFGFIAARLQHRKHKVFACDNALTQASAKTERTVNNAGRVATREKLGFLYFLFCKMFLWKFW